MIQPLSPSELASRIDHTFLHASGPIDAVDLLCADARRFEFAAVAVNPAQVARCRVLLSGTSTRVCAAVGFPLGQNTIATKLFEAQNAIDSGAQEIDMVINQRAVRAGEFQIVRDEIFGFSGLCRDQGVLSKIILECCNLTDDEKILICRLIAEAKCDFAKTSTGFGSHGATAHDVRLMKAHVGPDVAIKAAGGIRTLADATLMLEAGASRLGTSAGVAIVEELAGSAAAIANDRGSY